MPNDNVFHQMIIFIPNDDILEIEVFAILVIL